MLRKLALGLTAVIATVGIALGASGLFNSYPLVGESANTTCLSYGNNGVCNQYRPAGPSVLTGNETFPADTNASTGPATVNIQTSNFAGSYGGNAIFSTTGTTASVTPSDGIANYIYTGAGTATFTAFNLPANPINNQKLCLVNAGTGAITVSAVAASANTYGNTPTIVGTTPTTIPVMTATGTVVGTACWIYKAGASNTGIWYRSL